jgi:hypothetical protein
MVSPGSYATISRDEYDYFGNFGRGGAGAALYDEKGTISNLR